MLSGLSPPRRRSVLALVAVLAVCAVAIVGLGIFRAISTPSVVAQDDVGPVIVLSGYGGNTDVLEPIVEELEGLGREVWVFPPVADNRGDLSEQAQALDDFVLGVLNETDAGAVDLVGYSAGGVVARLWVRDYDGGQVARRVVTIGSPHHGTGVSSLATEAGGCPPACEQLRPDSDFLRRLNAGDETPAGPRWITLRTENDRTVTPSRSADLEGALTLAVQQYCPQATTSHGQLPSSAPVLSVLPLVLAEADLTPPGRDQVACG
ncbi:MAG: hypothetical protein WBG89_07055 [Ornithinimicrobium sp.]